MLPLKREGSTFRRGRKECLFINKCLRRCAPYPWVYCHQTRRFLTFPTSRAGWKKNTPLLLQWRRNLRQTPLLPRQLSPTIFGEGKPNPDVAASLNKLARVLQARGDRESLDEAIVLYKQSLKMNRKLYGKEPHESRRGKKKGKKGKRR